MSMEWPWSSPVCVTSGTDTAFKILISLLAVALLSCASANTFQSGPDIQVVIARASPGDTIIVGPGQYSPFEVNKPLAIHGINGPTIFTAVQRPGITINADDVIVSGFKIKGVGKDSTSKFNYYISHSNIPAGLRLNLPNAAIIVNGNRATIENATIFGAQVGIFAEEAKDFSFRNITFQSCDSGAELTNCLEGKVEHCMFLGCNKAGLDLEKSIGVTMNNNSFFNTTHVGLLLKMSDECKVEDNVFSGNTEGLALWNSSLNDVNRNKADRNYYGILLSGSNNNTLIDNLALENRRSEIVKGFGVGISLQENSSYNILARNTAQKNLNGIELIRGCRINAIYGNNASENDHGIRLDKNYNNLIYCNNFIRNNINAYENASHNTWNNTTIGNYYSDYRGKDENGDDIGDQPYLLPGEDSKSVDSSPLMRPCFVVLQDLNTLRKETLKYAKYSLEDEEAKPYKFVSGTIVIESKPRKTPPKLPASKPLFD